MTEVHTPPYVVNIGPQHPSTHGVFRVKATLDGERIIDAEMVLGYLHRSMEKLAEERTFTHAIDAQIERFKVFEKAGLTELSIRLFDDPMEGLEILAQHVLPHFEKH